MIDFLSYVNSKFIYANELSTGDYFYIIPFAIFLIFGTVREVIRLFKDKKINEYKSKSSKFYEFDEVYYSNLDNPITVITKFKEYLYKSNDESLILFISCIHDNKKIIDVHYQEKLEKKFIFIDSKLAGLGIDNFILVLDNKNDIRKIKDTLINMSLYDYYGEQWIEELLNKGIRKLYITDCDGAIVMLYENKNNSWLKSFPLFHLE